ncbi:MAG: tryptophan-rich sensory protein [Clostridiales bacterium]|nr:tryptophan-rich sensory protein [Clostridiales bacterium]
MWKKIKPYVFSVIIALAVGGLSSILTRNNMEVYNNINRPPLAPPMILFPIVWSILFILMGISSAIVWVKRKDNSDAAIDALKTYALQLIVNFFWTIIFFNMQAYLFAFIWLLLLLVLIIIMIVQFKKISPLAGDLQIPYALWVAFAGYLTLMIYILNR